MACPGGESKVYKGIAQTIREFESNDRDGLHHFALMIKEKSQKNLNQLVKVLHDDDREDAGKAAMIILSMEGIFLEPLLDAMDDVRTPESQVRDMQAIVAVQSCYQKRIVDRLDDMLQDKTLLVRLSLPDEAEETPSPRRVCDEAYMMKRHLFADEDEETEGVNTGIYLDMTDEERDAEIERLRETRKWTSLIDQLD
jgi:hypothetical protein